MNHYTVQPPSGDKWDFKNPRHKKKLIEIVARRDGFWCRRCGTSNALSLHHKASRGTTPPELLLVGENSGKLYYRDDPFNLILLCMYPDKYLYPAKNMSCHKWVEHNYNLAIKQGYRVRPIPYKQQNHS